MWLPLPLRVVVVWLELDRVSLRVNVVVLEIVVANFFLRDALVKHQRAVGELKLVTVHYQHDGSSEHVSRRLQSFLIILLERDQGTGSQVHVCCAFHRELHWSIVSTDNL